MLEYANSDVIVCFPFASYKIILVDLSEKGIIHKVFESNCRSFQKNEISKIRIYVDGSFENDEFIFSILRDMTLFTPSTTDAVNRLHYPYNDNINMLLTYLDLTCTDFTKYKNLLPQVH